MNGLEYIKSLDPVKQGIEIEICEFLYNFVKENNIKTIVETGIFRGVSSTIFLSALPKDGRLISIEPTIRKDLIVPEELKSKWTIINEFSEKAIKSVAKELKSIDLFWHDGKHCYDNQWEEYNTFKSISRFIGSHDINHPGVIKAGSTAWKDFKENNEHKLIIEASKWGVLELIK